MLKPTPKGEREMRTLIHLKTFTIPRGVFTWRPEITPYDSARETLSLTPRVALLFHFDRGLYLSEDLKVRRFGHDNDLISAEWLAWHAGIVSNGEIRVPMREVSSP